MKYKIGDKFKISGVIEKIVRYDGSEGLYKHIYKFSHGGRYTEDYIDRNFIFIKSKSTKHPLTKIFK
jgi:hypothetical protein